MRARSPPNGRKFAADDHHAQAEKQERNILPGVSPERSGVRRFILLQRLAPAVKPKHIGGQRAGQAHSFPALKAQVPQEHQKGQRGKGQPAAVAVNDRPLCLHPADDGHQPEDDPQIEDIRADDIAYG
jgi:hypothetical protein